MTGWKDLNAESLPAPMRARWETFREAVAGDGVFPGLAILAAFPPVITAHLLGGLAQNFIPGAKDISALVAQLLLSPLCRSLGRGVYEIYPEIQETLRSGITDPALEVRLAHFLDVYRQECAAEIPGPAMREALRWAAITILEPKTAAEEYLAAYNENRTSELERMDAWQSRTAKPGKGVANPYQAAVQLVRGARSFESGQRENALLEQLRELAPLLKAEEGGARVKTRVPESLWDWLQVKESKQEEEETLRNEYTLKVHILFETDSDINGVMEKAFGVMGNFSGKAFDLVQGAYAREKDVFHINYWVTDECGLPGLTDNLWISKNGIYFVLIDYHPALAEENSRQALTLRRLLDRFRVRLPNGTQIFLIVVLTGEHDFDSKADKELQNTLKEEEIMLTMAPSDPGRSLWLDFIRDTAYKMDSLNNLGKQKFTDLKSLPEGIFSAGDLAKKAGVNLPGPEHTINNFIHFAVESGGAIRDEQLFKETSEDTMLITGVDLFLQDLSTLFRVSQPWNAGPSILDIGDLKGHHDPEWTARILESYCLLNQVDKKRIEIPWRVNNLNQAPIIDQKKETIQYLIFFLNPFCEEILFQFQAWIKRQFPFAPVHISRNGFALEISEPISEVAVMIDLEEFEEVFRLLQRLAGDLRLDRQQSVLFKLHEKFQDHEKKIARGMLSGTYYREIKNNLKESLFEIIKEFPIVESDKKNLKIEAFLDQRSKTFTLQLGGNTSDQKVKYWITQFNNFQLRYFPGLTHTLTQRRIPAHATPEMITVEAGTFQMGDVMNDNEYNSEKPVHQVALDAFAIGKYPVTMEEYDAFCAATGREKPKDEGWGRGNLPAINVSWFDAVEYCNWLSELWGLEPAYRITKPSQSSDPLVLFNRMKNGYRLPTEAEWEFAARAGGGKVRFGNGKDIADPKEINFNASKDYKKPYSITGEYRRRTTPVDQFPPSPLGLHDMSGNVWEWCWDWSGTYPSEPQTNPTGPDSGSYRVVRGGSWNFYPADVRCANRYNVGPGYRFSYLGFRLARTVTS